MISNLRKPYLALVLLILFCTEIIMPPMVIAGGPGAPEIERFTPYDSDGLVNPFTGDFTYNIPLLEIGGYPINIAYSSGMGVQDEASWVGLGWSLNPGAINRNVRGLPDDFKGDPITKSMNIKDDETIGLSTGPSLEYSGFGTDNGLAAISAGFNIGFSYNNYRGWDQEQSYSAGLKAGANLGDSKLTGNLSLSFGTSSSEGAFLAPNAGLSYSLTSEDHKSTFGLGVGTRITSKEGLKSISFKSSFDQSWQRTEQGQSQSRRQLTSFGHAFPLSFSKPTFTPSFSMPKQSISGTFDAKLSGEVAALAIGGHIQGYFAKQALTNSLRTQPAFGYMYSHSASAGNALLDYNREKDGPYMEENPNLFVTNFTYDTYNVSGQGLGGSFRPFRGDVGMLFDPSLSVESHGISGGFEIGVGNLFHAGIDLVVNITNNISKKWEEGNALSNIFTFEESIEGTPEYEPVYFKNVGEKTALKNEDLFHNLGGFEPVYVPVRSNGECTDSLVTASGQSRRITANQHLKLQREPRATTFSWLTAREASANGLVKKLRSYRETMGVGVDDFTGERYYAFSFENYDRETDEKKAHHTSEITVLREDGVRYVYGLPVYNQIQKEVSFNVSGTAPNEINNLVDYAPTDNSVDNANGDNNFFSAVTTPGHAYAYLLTGIVSQDYVDLSANGPSPDDFGTYTKFNYKKEHDNFKWRSPVEQHKAHFNPGYLSDDQDNLGSYIYGEKELWYVHSIETKNFIATFHTSDREDGLGTIDENGGRNDLLRVQRLDSIKLFSRSDLLRNGPTRAIPIKTVHFEYDYSLCPGVPNSTPGNGKLTLRKISFSFGSSEREMLNPYEFTYAVNPFYSPQAADRWGSYKENDPALPNSYFPYVKQHEDTDDFAASWQLSRITLPSTGILNVEYESDDYGYVQDRRAMQLTPILGFSETSNVLPATPNILYDGDANYNYLFFQVKEGVDNLETLREYVTGIEELYINAQVDVYGNTTSTPQQPEQISAFVPVDLTLPERDYGFYSDDTAWIKIAEPSENNPLAHASWQTLRKSLPNILYPQNPPDLDDFLVFLGNMTTQIPNIINMYNEFFNKMKGEERGKRVNLDRSFVRLNTPFKNKFGGGVRVKRIILSDEWGNMVSDPDLSFEYGQEFEYTIDEMLAGEEQAISSGVASYEPHIGNDENPFVTPVHYKRDKILAADVFYYETEPYGESFFPGATVGYRQVKVRNIPHPEVSRTGSGHRILSFYTAKDFPTITSRTSKDHTSHEIPPLSPFYSEKTVTLSQGFYVELNDMHGKEKSIRIYQETDPINPISGVDWTYKTDPENQQRLDNLVSVINAETGATEQKLVGVEYDFITDAREFVSQTHSPGVQINSDAFLASIIPIYIPGIFPEYSQSFQRYRGIVTTKVVQRSGLLDHVTAFELGSVLTTSNEAYDPETGQVLITATNDQFDENYFQTVIPAHWQYDGMGGAFRNLGLVVDSVNVVGGLLTYGRASSLFAFGDELIMEKLDDREAISLDDPAFASSRLLPPHKGWVYWLSGNAVTIIDALGNPYPNGLYRIKVLRSGRRNMPSKPVGSVVTKSAPNESSDQLSFSAVIDASAMSYDLHWQTYAAFQTPVPESNCACSFTRQGTDGNKVLDMLFRFLRDEAPQTDGEGLVSSTEFNTYLDRIMGAGVKRYYTERNGSRFDIYIQNNDRTPPCKITLRTADLSPFPDHIGYDEILGIPNVESFACLDSYDFTLSGLTQDEMGPREVQILVSSDCFKILDCDLSTETSEVICGLTPGATVNPFILGILNNWRAVAEHTFLGTRQEFTSGSNQNSGIYQSFNTFWELPGSFTIAPVRDVSKWQNVQMSTVIDPLGHLLESKDPLDRYTSMVYGYGFSLPTFNASNARHQQIAFENFEDYNFRNVANSPLGRCPLPEHWKFIKADIELTRRLSHSGNTAIRVQTTESILRETVAVCDPDDTRTIPSGSVYRVQDCDLIRNFAPTEGKYLITAWVNENKPLSTLTTTYEQSALQIGITNSSGAVAFSRINPGGPIIDGWQLISGTFTLPADTYSLEVSLMNDAASAIYFDDIIIQPFDAVAEAFVFDDTNLRLKARLDENSYTVFFEYDQEGKLTRTKKETEQGVVTFQEVKSAKAKR